MPTPVYVGSGDPDGEVLGRSSGKVGFYGLATPTLTTATSGGFGFATSAAFNSFSAQLEELRATIVALGLHAGA
jgi:hypothetical protein